MSDRDPDAVLARLATLAVVPVVRLDDPAAARPLGDALRDAGLPVAEITFRTDAAAAAIAALAGDAELLVGAGSVTTLAQARTAIDAGARFVVSPGLDRDVVGCCQDAGILALPGVATPTEIMAGRALGLSVLKLFPADLLGGIGGMRALAAPFPGLRFVPTGGIGAEDLAAWLREPLVLAVGGSWMVRPESLRAGRFDEVRRLAADAVRIRVAVREG